MEKGPFPQRQLLTVRQILAAIAVVACVVFVMSYSSRVVLGMRAKNELVQWQDGVRDLQDFQAEIQSTLDGVGDAATIEEYVRNEKNWVKPGDQPVAPLRSSASEQATEAIIIEEPVASDQPANWELWWQLVTPETETE